MIRLYALGSGSKGNAFALETADATLLVDAGFSAREIARRAATVGLALDRLVGIALTHEHGDHAAGAVRLGRQYGAPVVATAGTLGALTGTAAAFPSLPLRSSSVTEIGPFAITCCPVLHDAAEPVALVVECAGVRLGLAYDFGRATTGLRYLFRELDAVILEANYDEVLLRTSDYPPAVQHRIAGSGGHLSNRGAAGLLVELFTERLRAVLLAHLSQRCNRPEVALATVGSALEGRGFRGRVAVALQELPLDPIELTRQDPERGDGARGAPYRDRVEPVSSPVER